MIYYNPDDPAIVVETRFGSKLGFNYARLSVKIVMAVLLLAVIVTYSWTTAMMFAGIVS